MKSFLLTGLLIVILLATLGCQQNAASTDNSNIKADMKSYVEPEPSDWVKYTKPIREYMYYRTQAVLNNDINLLWDQYPDLKDNVDPKLGVNIENNQVESLNKSFELLDANYDIESNDRIKVKTINENEVVVLVHGSIIYLRND